MNLDQVRWSRYIKLYRLILQAQRENLVKILLVAPVGGRPVEVAEQNELLNWAFHILILGA